MIAVLACLACLLGTGCAGSLSNDAALTVLADRQASLDARRHAADLVARQSPDAPARLAVLRDLLWSATQPLPLRQHAARELARHDPDVLQRDLMARLPLLDHWPTLTLLCDLIARQGWRSLTPALVRSLARPVDAGAVADDQRPEYLAIAQLWPDRSPEAILAAILHDDATFPGQPGDAPAAWEILVRRLGPADALAALHGAARPATEARLPARPKPPTAALLFRAYRELGVIPVNRAELLWLFRLADPTHPQRWRDATRSAQAFSHLQPIHLRDLAIRRAALILQPHPDPEADADALAQALRRRLRDQPIFLARHESTRTGHPDALRRQAIDRLPPGDRLAALTLLTGLGDPRLRAALFEQSDRDRADGATELGGVIDLTPHGLTVRPYPPERIGDDRRYYPPAAMMTRLHLAPAHYHFHSQRTDNIEYAGPGAGDLAFARRMRLHCLVFTSIDINRLNVDYHQPDDIVLDLGVIHRPGADDPTDHPNGLH